MKRLIPLYESMLPTKIKRSLVFKKMAILGTMFTIIAVACNSTAHKLKKGAISYERNMIKQRGEEIESIKVDSLEYSLSTMKSFYLARALEYTRQSRLSSKLLSEIRPMSSDPSKYVDSPLQRDAFKYRLYSQACDSLAFAADTTQKIWYLSYHFKAASNKNTWDNHADVFLDLHLKPILFNPALYVSDQDIQSRINELKKEFSSNK